MESIQQSKTFLEIRDTLLAEYEVKVEECDRDLQEFLQQLERSKIIKIVKEEAS